LRELPLWGSMYPPLPARVGQVEKLWTFSTQRRRGVASQFAQLMFNEAQRAGLVTLRTHIHEQNGAARTWAQRTGWAEVGTIERYQLDVRGFRGPDSAVCVHRREQVVPRSAQVPFAGSRVSNSEAQHNAPAKLGV
jgi:hypothetical protein